MKVFFGGVSFLTLMVSNAQDMITFEATGKNSTGQTVVQNYSWDITTQSGTATQSTNGIPGNIMRAVMYWTTGPIPGINVLAGPSSGTLGGDHFSFSIFEPPYAVPGWTGPFSVLSFEALFSCFDTSGASEAIFKEGNDPSDICSLVAVDMIQSSPEPSISLLLASALFASAVARQNCAHCLGDYADSAAQVHKRSPQPLRTRRIG